ncbi:MAG: hypothetical protein PHS53_02025 [Candidatus Pacebacteria bacterium]|nr:hypothetical protein [Candidatus Paceibacterota bacterium]
MDNGTEAKYVDVADRLWEERNAKDTIVRDDGSVMAVFRVLEINARRKARRVILGIKFVGGKIFQQLFVVKKEKGATDICHGDRLIAVHSSFMDIAGLAKASLSERLEKALAILENVAHSIRRDPGLLEKIRNPKDCRSVNTVGGQRWDRRRIAYA